MRKAGMARHDTFQSIHPPIDRQRRREILSPAMAKHSSHILELARKGADHRYQELKAEIASLEKHFPHLGEPREGRGAKSAQVSASAAEASHPARKRRTMSAAARKKISDAQKARWAKQKGKKG